MNELLLQTIVEKLEALEIALLKKDDNQRKDPGQKYLITPIKFLISEFDQLKSQLTENNDATKKLVRTVLDADNNKQSKVKHIHHFHGRVWVTVSLFLISLLPAYGWINCYNEKKVFEAND